MTSPMGESAGGCGAQSANGGAFTQNPLTPGRRGAMCERGTVHLGQYDGWKVDNDDPTGYSEDYIPLCHAAT